MNRANTPKSHVAGSEPILERVHVISNQRIAQGVGLVTLQAPAIAERVAPGQFIHLRIARGAEFILRRPFSVHRRRGDTIEILYQVLGTGTRALSLLEPGAQMDAVGPVGRGWHLPEGAGHVLFVTGGLGAAPLGMFAEQLAQAGVALTVVMGAPTADRLVARDLFESVARRLEVATDDGSAGERGYSVALSERLMFAEKFDAVYTCGPEVMQRIVATQASEHGIYCEVSMERLMACGIGACLSCIVTTVHGLRRACIDGPVFGAQEVCWDASELPPKH